MSLAKEPLFPMNKNAFTRSSNRTTVKLPYRTANAQKEVHCQLKWVDQTSNLAESTAPTHSHLTRVKILTWSSRPRHSHSSVITIRLTKCTMCFKKVKQINRPWLPYPMTRSAFCRNRANSTSVDKYVVSLALVCVHWERTQGTEIHFPKTDWNGTKWIVQCTYITFCANLWVL